MQTLLARILICHLALAFSSGVQNCQGQTSYRESWAKRFGGGGDDRVYAAAVAPQGFPIVSGMTSSSLNGPSAGLYDAFVRKLDPNGGALWTRQIGTAQDDTSRGVAVDAAGNIFVSGSTSGELAGANLGGSDFFLTKLDSGGNGLWTQQFGSALSDQALDIAVDAVGNAYVAGYQDVVVNGKNSTDCVLAKFSPQGGQLWSRTFGSSTFDYAESVTVDATGHVYVAGSTGGSIGQTGAGGFDAYLRKYDSTGEVIWTQQFGTPSSDKGYGVDVDGAGHVYITGTTGGNLGGPVSGGSDIYLAKFDSAGSRLWTRQVGGLPAEQAHAVAVDSAGNPYVAGDSGDSAVLWRFNASGEQPWIRFVTSTDNLSGYAVASHEGGVYFGGLIRGGTLTPRLGSYDGFIVKYAAPGDYNADARIDGSDFLAWQRGNSPIPNSSYDLDEWKRLTFQNSAVMPVPEPQARTWVAAAYLGLLSLGSRRYCERSVS